MSTIGERIKKRRLALGLSVDQVAKQLGKDRATVYRYESDEIGNMPLSIIEPLARILGVSPAYIMGWESIEESFEVKKIPVLGKIAAGEPILACEEHCEYVVLNHDVNVDFCLRVKGDSMVNARIQDGDGDTFSVEIWVQNIPQLDEYSLVVSFPSFVRPASVWRGTAARPDSFTWKEEGPGRVRISSQAELRDLVKETLAILNFEALAAGDGEIKIISIKPSLPAITHKIKIEN